MSIARLGKVTFYGLLDQKEQALAGLQEMGCVHLLPLRSKSAASEQTGPSPAARNALKYLLSCPERRHQVSDTSKFDAVAVELRALEIQTRTQALRNERDFLVRRIGELQPWGEFKPPSAEELGGLKLWLYVVPHYQMKELQASGLVWQEVSRDNRFRYVVIVAGSEPQKAPGKQVPVGDKSLSQRGSRLEDVEVELEDLQGERVALTRWLTLFIRSLSRLEDRAELDNAAQQTHDDDPLFALQGWASAEIVTSLQSYAERNGLAVTVEDPGPDDNPPTLYKNPEPVSGGQDLVSFYMTPSYRLWDPSSIVFFSFTVFFAMILSDAGYAVVFGVILAAFWKRMGASDTGRRLRTLFGFLVGASVVWGVLTGGYFGVTPREGSLLGSLKVLDIRDADTMMPLSILIGVAHIVAANLAMAWTRRGSPQAFAPIGWAIIILSGCALWLGLQGVVPEWVATAAPWIMGAGLLCVVLFSSTKSHPIWRILDGLLALTSLTKAFGDVLSYLRLFALGLASASLALAFNGLAQQVAGGVAGFGTFLALLILVLGHGINFALAIMSGFVHGLRLNYIEFFNWGLPEEGTVFRAFAKKEGATWSPSSSH